MNQGNDLEYLRSRERSTKQDLLKSIDAIFRLLAEHLEE